jgi:hypothetical protein
MTLAAVTAMLLLGGAPAPGYDGVLDQAFGWVRSLWEALDEGWHIDPDGLTVSSPQPTSDDGSDNGAHIDPDGLAVSSPQPTADDGSDNGWHIDPNG